MGNKINPLEELRNILLSLPEEVKGRRSRDGAPIATLYSREEMVALLDQARVQQLDYATLLELIHRYLAYSGETDSLGGMEWARRIDEAGGPEAYRRRAMGDLAQVIESLEDSSEPQTSLAGLQVTWEKRYGPGAVDEGRAAGTAWEGSHALVGKRGEARL